MASHVAHERRSKPFHFEIEWPAMFQVYILELIDGSYYVGFTNNLDRRLNEHVLGIACNHTKKIPMKKLLWSEYQPDRLHARQREKEIKGWRREKKEQLWKSLP